MFRLNSKEQSVVQGSAVGRLVRVEPWWDLGRSGWEPKLESHPSGARSLPLGVSLLPS